MPSVNQTPAERARKMHSMFLQRLQGDASSIAAAMGVSESTVSRLKTEHGETIFLLLAHLGLKTVDIDRTCVRTAEIELLRALYARVNEQAPWLLQEGDA